MRLGTKTFSNPGARPLQQGDVGKRLDNLDPSSCAGSSGGTPGHDMPVVTACRIVELTSYQGVTPGFTHACGGFRGYARAPATTADGQVDLDAPFFRIYLNACLPFSPFARGPAPNLCSTAVSYGCVQGATQGAACPVGYSCLC